MGKSDDDVRTMLIKDPDLPWSSSFPYERLSQSLRQKGCAEVGPDSTSRRIKDLLFDLMPVPRADREAWEELRKPERRLLLDFLMYSLEVSKEELWSDELWELPMPLYMPDFRELANGKPDYEKMISAPASFPVPPLPAAAPLDLEASPAEAVNIGSVSVDEYQFLGD